MKIKNNQSAINPDNPFEDDKLDRNKLVQNLSHFVKSGEGPFVLAINSPWGSGKTWFLQRWEQVLSKGEDVCFYFNAWENDFAEDPLIPIIGGLSEEILLKRGKDENIKKAISKVKKIAGAIALRAIPIAVRLATQGIVDTNKAIEAGFAELAEKFAQDRLDAFAAGKKEIVDFRKSLFTIADNLVEDGGKLIIMIDELDRCRPLFAIQLLERIKHLFDINGIVFVLGIYLGELSQSIRAVYGNGFDANGYLRRFIDFDFNLPEPNQKEYCEYLVKDWKYLKCQDFLRL